MRKAAGRRSAITTSLISSPAPEAGTNKTRSAPGSHNRVNAKEVRAPEKETQLEKWGAETSETSENKALAEFVEKGVVSTPQAVRKLQCHVSKAVHGRFKKLAVDYDVAVRVLLERVLLKYMENPDAWKLDLTGADGTGHESHGNDGQR